MSDIFIIIVRCGTLAARELIRVWFKLLGYTEFIKFVIPTTFIS